MRQSLCSRFYSEKWEVQAVIGAHQVKMAQARMSTVRNGDTARYATRKSQKEITQNQKEETMTEDYDKGEDPDLKLVAIVITECLQEGKTTGLADGLCE